MEDSVFSEVSSILDLVPALSALLLATLVLWRLKVYVKTKAVP